MQKLLDACSLVGHFRGQMGTEIYDAEIKTRVTARQKNQFQRLANDRHLDVSDIVREALRNYLATNPPTVKARKELVPA